MSRPGIGDGWTDTGILGSSRQHRNDPTAAGHGWAGAAIVPDMKTRPMLTLADARTIAAAAETEALQHQWAVSIAIVDDGGHLLWLQRLDGAAPISAQIAPAKAATAALGRRESRVYEEMINQGRVSFLSAPGLQGLLEGGVPIVVDGHCVGAVGVSGVKSSEDAQIGRAGIAALMASQQAG